MLLINRLGIIFAILICTANFSYESLLRDILNSGKAFFTKNQPISDRIISQNHDDQSEDKDYEKPTHRETDYDRYENNKKNNDHFQEHTPTSSVHKKTSKQEQEYNHKYVMYTHTKYPSSLNLYSVLGGLSFASLLATTLIIFLRRNGSLFRTFEDNDLFRSRRHIHGHHGYIENDNSYNLFKLIDHSKKYGRKKSQ